ncbi:uncharacterized protein LOC117134391 [Brassica rapa]|uniref:uncharacterized protein LOC117134391 n=1 Tax=Brassica campestris TaxID=3711 RepID=UPI00142E1A6B|nr:uncharacterized protein LOC117134391 [Brassica rapa]
MVKMFFGNPSGKRNKLPVQRAPPLYDEPTIPNSTEIESPVVVEERVTNIVEEVEEIHNEEVIAESDSSSVEGDDCEVIVEDRAGYKENELFEVEVGETDLSSHFQAAAQEYGDDLYDANDDSGDDIWDDDHIPDPLFSDDRNVEEEGRQFNYGPDDILALGKTFNTAEEFKYAVLKYSLKTQYDIKFYKSSSDRLGAHCTQHVEEKCPWRVYCSFERGRNKLMVKVYNDSHICVRSGYTKLLKSGTIGQIFEERLRINPKIKSQEMVDEIKREYNMIVSPEQCRRAKSVLSARRKAVKGCETLLGFGITKKRQSCRPIIGLDDAFMKWDIKGQMLAAVGRDGDNRIFPIAWAVVEVEDNPNWLWFVQLLKNDLELEDGSNCTIISDKHRGILNAVHEELPKAEHRMCARHILENWKKTNKDIELERLFWKIARSYTPAAFRDNVEALKKYNVGAYESLQSTAPTTWSRAFFKLGSFCNDNLNNLSESFNRSVRESRRKPLLDMLTEVRRKNMVRNAKRTLLTNRWNKRFTPRADKEIELNRQKAMDCIRYMTTGHSHEIEYHSDAYTVNMEEKTCGCGYWQLNGLPCMHAMCVITTTKLNLNNYVSDYYLTSTWRQLYYTGMKPIQGMKLWPRLGRLPMLHPPSRFNRGRPNTHARRKGPHESATNPHKLTRHGRVGTCSNCRKEGHNKTRCPNPTAAPPPKRPRGRPRKAQGESLSFGASQTSQPSQESQGGFGFSS